MAGPRVPVLFQERKACKQRKLRVKCEDKGIEEGRALKPGQKEQAFQAEETV